MKIKTLVVDDEELARLRLKDMLHSLPDIELIGEAVDGDDALDKINSLRPQLIFLDIEMPGRDGFEVLRELTYKPEIIFTTAYDQHALDAFRVNAMAYLLKPVDPDKLSNAVERVCKILDDAEEPQAVVHDHFVSKHGNKIKFIDHKDAIYLQSEDKYTMLHANDGNTYVLDETLNFYEHNLVGNFIRIHRSIIIQVPFIQYADKIDQGRFVFVMKDGSELQSSSSYQAEIKRRLRV
ncbi:MAG: response regulator transcription factor [Calditrichaeota bacterium]|nr:response regulator transcription factor [Calditrichota bacterium]